jgi:hypothetical protein
MVARRSSAFRSATLPEKETPAKIDDSYKLVMSVDMVRAKLSELRLENFVEACVEYLLFHESLLVCSNGGRG